MFKPISIAAAICLAGASALASTPAFARGGHHGGFRAGIYLGAPLYFPYAYSSYYYPPYYPPYYTNPAVVYGPQAPPVYIEQGTTQAVPPMQQSAPQLAQAPANYWYFCADSSAYFPYVKECASPWQRVSPQPPSERN